jgi:hypothetical protein
MFAKAYAQSLGAIRVRALCYFADQGSVLAAWRFDSANHMGIGRD